MPSIEKVKRWYAQSFEVRGPALTCRPHEELTSFRARAGIGQLPAAGASRRASGSTASGVAGEREHSRSGPEPFAAGAHEAARKPAEIEARPTTVAPASVRLALFCTTARPVESADAAISRCSLFRYYSQPDETLSWPPEVHDYNDRFTRLLSNIKRRHDPVVTTVAQGILEFKRDRKSTHIDRSIQTFLDRFYMSRIGTTIPSPTLTRATSMTDARSCGRYPRPHRAAHRVEPPGTARGEFAFYRALRDTYKLS